jgi:hypothetical protein
VVQKLVGGSANVGGRKLLVTLALADVVAGVFAQGCYQVDSVLCLAAEPVEIAMEDVRICIKRSRQRSWKMYSPNP